MNIFNLVGRLVKDVELRQVGDNKVTSNEEDLEFKEDLEIMHSLWRCNESYRYCLYVKGRKSIEFDK